VEQQSDQPIAERNAESDGQQETKPEEPGLERTSPAFVRKICDWSEEGMDALFEDRAVTIQGRDR